MVYINYRALTALLGRVWGGGGGGACIIPMTSGLGGGSSLLQLADELY